MPVEDAVYQRRVAVVALHAQFELSNGDAARAMGMGAGSLLVDLHNPHPVPDPQRTVMTRRPHQPPPRSRHGGAVALCLALTLGGCESQPDPPSADGTAAPATTAPATSATDPQPPIPTAFPVPPGATESTASATSQDSVRVQFEVTSATAAELVGFFDEQLEAQGWTVSGRREADGTTRYRIEGHGWSGAVTIFGDLDPVAFLVQLGTAPG